MTPQDNSELRLLKYFNARDYAKIGYCKILHAIDLLDNEIDAQNTDLDIIIARNLIQDGIAEIDEFLCEIEEDYKID